jgi:hypothetical protein
MSTTPTKNASQRFGWNGGRANTDDIIQLVNGDQTGPVAWIDATGTPQGAMAIPTPEFSDLEGTLSVPSQVGATGTPSSSTYLRGDGTWAAGTGGISSPVGSPSPFVYQTDMQFQGPNPWIDVRAYGVRAVNPNATPAATGLTANTQSGQAGVTISAASSFVNGDGVVLYGAGATHSMTTPSQPTVTPSIASSATGTGVAVAGPTGSTSYSYQIIARNTAGGMTAASTILTITNGVSSLGEQTVAVTSLARSNNIVTVTCSASHGLIAGAMVFISGTSNDYQFKGWFNVSTIVSGTVFTFISGLDTRGTPPAASSATGGNVIYYNCNHLVLPTPQSGMWQYYIYGRSSGSMALLGVSCPNVTDINTDPTFMVWDDYGATMSGNVSLPAYVPTTPPSGATANHLVTTISSGAGSTSLTLATTAGQTLSGATIRFDNTPTIEAALAAAQATSSGGGALYFPAPETQSSYTPQYVTNSYLTLANAAVFQAGQLYLGDTMQFTGTWRGLVNSVEMLNAQFSIERTMPINVPTANPGIYVAAGNTQMSGIGVNATNNTNGYNCVFVDSSAIPSVGFEHCLFAGSGSNDYVGVPVICWASYTNAGAGILFRQCVVITGPGDTGGTTCTPGMIFRNASEINIDGIFMAVRCMYFAQNTMGLYLTVNQHYETQGGITPLVMFGGGTGIINAEIQNTVQDTMGMPLVTAFGYCFGTVSIRGTSGPAVNTPLVSGALIPSLKIDDSVISAANIGQNLNVEFSSPYGLASDGVFGSTSNPTYTAIKQLNQSMSVGSNNSIFVTGAAPVLSTPTVSSGGSVPVGTLNYAVVPVFPNGTTNGAEGTQSNFVQATTTSGNQTVNLSWTAVPGAIGYNVSRQGQYVHTSGGTYPQVAAGTTTYTDSSSLSAGGSISSIASGGPVALNGQGYFGPVTATQLNQIASGNIAGSVSFSSSTTATVTFGTPFNSTPAVFLQPLNPGSITVTLTSNSKTGFTITASGSTSISVYWQAIGDPN